MITIDKTQLFTFLECEADSYDDYKAMLADYERPLTLTDEQWQYLKGCTFKTIVHGTEMSEDHLGGDDMVGVADDVLIALKEGFQICTWYGSDAEAMVVGYRADCLTITEPPDEDDEDDAIGVDQDGEPVTHHSTGHPACPAVNGGTCPIEGHNHDEDDE